MVRPVIVIHRASNLVAESKKDIGKPLPEEADFIELDLDISRDGLIFVFHDPRVGMFVFCEPLLLFPGGIKKKAHEVLFSEIQKVYPNAIRFEEIIKYTDPSRLVCELKSYTAYRGIVHILHRMYSEAFHKMRFISFSMKALLEIKNLDSSIYCGYIATSAGDDKRFHFMVHKKHITQCAQNGIEEISGHWLTFRPRMIRMAHTKGLKVGIGQINTSYRARYSKKNEVDVWYKDNFKL